MSIKEALAEYDRLLYAHVTTDELEASLAALIKDKEIGRASGYYRPADDPCEEDDPLWP